MATSRTGKPIIIAEYDPTWPQRFQRERAAIVGACGRASFVSIEHVGSTAVPGLAAKPIIDIMPGIRSLDDAPALIPLLESIGWEYASEAELPSEVDGGMPFRRYFRKDTNGERACHMHMVEVESDFFRSHLLFRDFLRISPADAAEYARVKRAIAAKFNAAQPAASSIYLGYTDKKSDCIAAIMAKARAHFAQNS